MSEQLLPRPRPCPSCPYRVDVPSGVWAAEEYGRLPAYDGEIHEQAAAGAWSPFCCHQGDGALCSGWLGHREHPADLLAVRVGISCGRIAPQAADYTTTVALWPSGAAAAEHGLRDLPAPGWEAAAAAEKIRRVRAARGDPVEQG